MSMIITVRRTDHENNIVINKNEIIKGMVKEKECCIVPHTAIDISSINQN